MLKLGRESETETGQLRFFKKKKLKKIYFFLINIFLTFLNYFNTLISNIFF